MNTINKSKVRILCISDLHLGTNDPQGVYGETLSTELSNSLKDNKLSMLKEAILEKFEDEKIDLLFFSGDYLIGKDSVQAKESYNLAFSNFLKEIESTPEIFTDRGEYSIRDRIFIIPGNHDIDRNASSEERLNSFIMNYNAYIHPFREKSTGITKYAPLFVYDELKIIIACISTVENGGTESEIITEVIQYIENYTTDTDKNKTKNKLLKELQKLQKKDIASIPSKTEKAFINANKELEKKDPNKYTDYKRIIISHHPLLSGIEKLRVVKEYPNTIGGFQLMNIALTFNYSLFIHGHNHEFLCLEFCDKTMGDKGNAVQLGLPSFHGDGRLESQIVVVEIGDNPDDTVTKLLYLDKITRSFKEKRYIRNENKTDNNQITSSDRILVDFEIEEIVNKAVIVKNADSSRIEAASYDCALGKKYKRGDSAYQWKPETLEPSSDGPAVIEIKSRETILIYTEEIFDIPDDMLLHASPISSWSRKGLRVDLSYFVDPGFKGSFCFPVTNLSDVPIKITSREPIMSIEFVKLGKRPNNTWNMKHPQKVKERNNYEDK